MDRNSSISILSIGDGFSTKAELIRGSQRGINVQQRPQESDLVAVADLAQADPWPGGRCNYTGRVSLLRP